MKCNHAKPRSPESTRFTAASHKYSQHGAFSTHLLVFQLPALSRTRHSPTSSPAQRVKSSKNTELAQDCPMVLKVSTFIPFFCAVALRKNIPVPQSFAIYCVFN